MYATTDKNLIASECETARRTILVFGALEHKTQAHVDAIQAAYVTLDAYDDPLIMCEVCGQDILQSTAYWHEATETDGCVPLCKECHSWNPIPDERETESGAALDTDPNTGDWVSGLTFCPMKAHLTLCTFDCPGCANAEAEPEDDEDQSCLGCRYSTRRRIDTYIGVCTAASERDPLTGGDRMPGFTTFNVVDWQYGKCDRYERM